MAAINSYVFPWNFILMNIQASVFKAMTQLGDPELYFALTLVIWAHISVFVDGQDTVLTSFALSKFRWF